MNKTQQENKINKKVKESLQLLDYVHLYMTIVDMDC